MKPSWMGWQGRGQCPNFTDVLLPHRPTILLPPDPRSAPFPAQHSLEVPLLTIPTPFLLLTGLPAMYALRNLRQGAMADRRWTFQSMPRRNQQSNCHSPTVY